MKSSSKPHSLDKKSFLRYALEGANQELISWRNLVRYEWPLVLLLAILLTMLFVYARPLPPKEVSIAAGQPDTSFYLMAKRYAKFFEKHGVTLKLIQTDGSQENLNQLIEKKGIQSALLLAGTIQKKEFPQVVSLGSVQQVPLWLFYRGNIYTGDDPFAHFAEERTSIGGPGSGTQRILKELLTLHAPLLSKPKHLLQLPHAEGAEALIQGKIEALATADAYRSPTIQRLLKTPNLHIYNFSLADAYVKKMPFLDVVTIPRGALNIESVYPPSDIKMVSSSMTLLIEKDLHPAIQLLFMMASDEFGDARDQFFARPDEFPSYKDHAVPLSPVAKNYFANGPSIISRFLPFWVTSFIDRMWLLLLAIVTVAFPIFKMLPNYRLTRARIQLSTAYEELRQIETLLQAAQTQSEYEDVLADLDALETAMRQLTIPASNLNKYYSLCSALNLVRKNAGDQLKRLQDPAT